MAIVQACCVEVSDVAALKNALKAHVVGGAAAKRIQLKSLYDRERSAGGAFIGAAPQAFSRIFAA